MSSLTLRRPRRRERPPSVGPRPRSSAPRSGRSPIAAQSPSGSPASAFSSDHFVGPLRRRPRPTVRSAFLASLGDPGFDPARGGPRARTPRKSPASPPWHGPLASSGRGPRSATRSPRPVRSSPKASPSGRPPTDPAIETPDHDDVDLATTSGLHQGLAAGSVLGPRAHVLDPSRGDPVTVLE